MKKLDSMIKQAKKLLKDTIVHLWPIEADCFIEALGLDKTKYEVTYPDGYTGYNFIDALNDAALECWGDYSD